jgi:hypothetical protein
MTTIYFKESFGLEMMLQLTKYLSDLSFIITRNFIFILIQNPPPLLPRARQSLS